jgi:5-methylcytosine-specific restriction enzyme subunit McrC
MSVVYRAREREETAIPVSEILRGNYLDIYPEVQRHAYFDVRLSGTQLLLTAGKYIGFIPLNDRVIIEVEPKISVRNLVHILARADGDIVELQILEREYAAGSIVPRSLFDAVAHAFVRSLRKLEVEGFLKRYAPVLDAGSSLKGRVAFAESVQAFWSRGRKHAVVCTYYDLLSDTAENRLLYFACYVLIRHYVTLGIESETLTALGYYDELFRSLGVGLSRPDFPFPPREQPAGPLYERSLRIAEAVILNQGIDLPSRGFDLELPSFLIDMETVFEKYLRATLTKRLEGHRVLDGNFEGAKSLFDDRSSPKANPDVVIWSGGACRVVGDVKYKSHEYRSDLNQVLAYALSYRADTVVIFLPVESRTETGLSLIGRIQNIALYRYGFNMAADELDTEEGLMADAILDLLPR